MVLNINTNTKVMREFFEDNCDPGDMPTVIKRLNPPFRPSSLDPKPRHYGLYGEKHVFAGVLGEREWSIHGTCQTSRDALFVEK